jgi:hypothetical protein
MLARFVFLSSLLSASLALSHFHMLIFCPATRTSTAPTSRRFTRRTLFVCLLLFPLQMLTLPLNRSNSSPPSSRSVYRSFSLSSSTSSRRTRLRRGTLRTRRCVFILFLAFRPSHPSHLTLSLCLLSHRRSSSPSTPRAFSPVLRRLFSFLSPLHPLLNSRPTPSSTSSTSSSPSLVSTPPSSRLSRLSARGTTV